jgi:hypothetical protein
LDWKILLDKISLEDVAFALKMPKDSLFLRTHIPNVALSDGLVDLYKSSYFVKKFTVDIESTSSAFTTAVNAATDKGHLDLISPSAANAIIFEVVPFPHGSELLGQFEIPFDLSAAQEPISIYPGTHTFKMTVVDNNFCKKEIIVKMVVE